MKITRKFTTAGSDPFASVKWVKRSSRITNPDGSVVFQMDDAEVPETWSQLATDIMVSKYFRKAGVPQEGADGKPLVATDGRPVFGPEKSARLVIGRLAGCWRHWGEKHGYFDTPADAQAFHDELAHMMVHQMAAPNSPQWFNTGLNWAYGISGPAQGHWYCEPKTGKAKLAEDAYTHPQPHACFIQSVSDDLVGPGGIMDLWVREARLFKYGSGTGTNFSRLRGEGESLSGGGKSSGLMSWLRIGDRAASAIKSGGTTRRAAKMVCLDMDHPDISAFINWKVREEIKVAAMVEGMKLLKEKNVSIREQAEALGLDLDYDFNGEAYYTVSGQNSNNSVRVPDEFFDALDKDGEWETRWRTSGKVARTFRARELWEQIGFAAWRCADPGIQFDSTINAWHTCPSGGRINASNPCSEYMFVDNTACNLASLNVLGFYDASKRSFDVERFEHAVDLWTVVLEVSVLMAAFPSKEIAELSYKYRTLGLGYANLGAMLMQAGIPYDSEEARAVCACLTSIMTGRSYRQSALMAAQLGAFSGYESDRKAMLRVIRNHRLAAHGEARDSGKYEGLRTSPVPIDHQLASSGRVRLSNARALLTHATKAWDEALALGEKHGYRNAQTTVIAPTGTIGLLMDCDTTGVEPDFALVKFKKLAGGGYFKIANDSVEPALRALGYTEQQVRDIMTYLLGKLDLHVPMPERGSAGAGTSEGQTFDEWLIDKGLNAADLEAVTRALPTVFELSHAFGAWALGDDALRRLKIDGAKAKADPSFSVLRALGLSERHVEELNRIICGTQTVEGAPHLRAEHLAVFDCANRCGKIGKRFIAPQGHIRMMAAAQPFISGAISKTINLPNEATVEDITNCYRMSWELGLKANALYRDGCKMSQPLSSTSGASETAAAAEAERPEDDSAPFEAGEETPAIEVTSSSAAAARAGAASSATASPEPEVRTVVQIVHRPMRRRLPDTRSSITHKFNIAGHEGYLTVGLYEDAKPGELFITMAKEGSTIGGIMDSLGTATSVALQYGVPIESLVNKFTYQRFEPAGMTTNPDIPFAKSLVDYIFRWMGMQFIPGYRAANAPQRGGGSDPHATSMEAPAPTGGEDRPRLREEPSWEEPSRGSGAESAARGGAPSDRATAPAAGGRLGVPSLTEMVASASVAISAGGSGPSHGTSGGRHGAGAGASGETAVVSVQTSTLTIAMESAGDGPPCDVCGTITVRAGTCHKCLNCGHGGGCG